MAESKQEPIVTERLILRQIRPSDSEAVFAFTSLPSVMSYTYASPCIFPTSKDLTIAKVLASLTPKSTK